METKFYTIGLGILMAALYIAIAIVFSDNVKTHIRSYERCDNYENLKSISAWNFIRAKEKMLVFMGSALFPMYICIALGAFFGDKMYDMIIGENNENRIASWLV